MGRKKKKTDALDSGTADDAADETDEFPNDLGAASSEPLGGSATATTAADGTKPKDPSSSNSNYAVTSHSADIIAEDIYVSDGSIDSDEEADNGIQLILTGSKTGLMRRGLHSLPLHQQPDRVWTRRGQDNSDNKEHQQQGNGGETAALYDPQQAEEMKRRKEEEELAKLDPAERAARLLQEKQRREQEAKLEARRLENEDNVTRDPLLFSKRTAFDIRFEQIEDKPWQRVEGNSHFAEYFNYGLQEDDWLEYAQQQLAIRQELIDASKHKRPPDPSIVPVQPRRSAITETEAVTVPSAPEVNNDGPSAMVAEAPPEPDQQSSSLENTTAAVMAPVEREETSINDAGLGGAWGAGAAPGTLLAKLIEEQELKQQQRDKHDNNNMDTNHVPSTSHNNNDDNMDEWNSHHHHHHQYHYSPEPPPPPQHAYYHRPPEPTASYHYDRPPIPMDRGYRDPYPPPYAPPFRGGGRGGRSSYHHGDDAYGDGGWKRPRDADSRGGWRR